MRERLCGSSRLRNGGILAAVTFEFYRFRFRFRALNGIHFPPQKAANLIRGAFGTIFQSLACRPDCRDAKSCEDRVTCPYARIFEPRTARGEGPSGLVDWPRPFVFRTAQLDGLTIPAGDRFYFDVHLFDVGEPAFAHFVAAFQEMGHRGLGPGRGRADLEAVDHLDLSGAPQCIFDGQVIRSTQLPAPNSVDLSLSPLGLTRARVRFLTPTELKSVHEPVTRPEFAVLFGRLRDRVSTLRALYGPGPLAIDFRATGQRAAAVRLIRCDWKFTDAERLSSRSGQRHSLGGFVGEAEYEGDLSEFIPYLELGRWTGVGRQTVWGKGEIAWEPR